jgi:prepilin-type N-terminal cleavage/methylation domain-containing protein
MHATSVTGNEGFTLLELLVVLTILVLMASAWPLAAQRASPRQRLRNEAQQLAAELRSARMTARLTGVRQEIVILPRGTGYQVSTEAYNLPEGLILSVRPGFASGPSKALVLFPDGSSSGGILDLRFYDQRSTVTVAPMTSRIEITE